MEFCPKIWQEDQVPKGIGDCKDCGLFEQETRMVWGEGNPKAPIMVILDNPGARENTEGDPYVCGTRQTLQKAIHEVGLTEKQLYITYILKRRPVRKYDKEETRVVCMQHLDEQLQTQHPSFIICLGNVAVQSFFGDPEVDVKGLRGDFHHVRGFRVTAAYHPLAARRRPNLYPLLVADFSLVAQGLKGP